MFAHRSVRNGRFAITGLAVFASLWATADTARGQAAAASANSQSTAAPVLRADPSELGLRIPVGDPIAGDDRRVQIKTDDDELVVAKVQVEVADRFVVVLPDGRINVVPIDEATLTDRPFVGVTSKDLSAKLQQKFPGFQVKSTPRFIYVFNTSKIFHTGTSNILESLYPGLVNYCKSHKLAVQDPPYPLVVIMFRTRKEWEDYMHGMFAGSDVAAFYDGASNRVLMYEQSEINDEAPEYAVKQIISTVAHEGVHQILHNIGVQQRLSRWPMWISEGLPEYFAPTSVSKSLRWKGAGQVNDLRMRIIADMIKQGERFTGSRGGPMSTVEAIITARDLDVGGYAWSWALTHYLGEKKKAAFYKFLEDVSRMSSLERSNTDAQKQLFVKHFGDNFAKLDADLLAHLHSLPYVDPIENMTHYVVLMQYPQGNLTMQAYDITTSQTEVQQLRTQLLNRLTPQEQRAATFNVRTFPTRTSAVVFARQALGR